MRGQGEFPPSVFCTCGCLGSEHYVRWDGDRFLGTRCRQGHGGHKFQPRPGQAVFERAGPYSHKVRCTTCGRSGYPGGRWQIGCNLGHDLCRRGCGKALARYRSGLPGHHVRCPKELKARLGRYDAHLVTERGTLDEVRAAFNADMGPGGAAGFTEEEGGWDFDQHVAVKPCVHRK